MQKNSSWTSRVAKGLRDMYPKHTAYMGDIKCPHCGLFGKLCMDLRHPTTYYYIIHYKETGLGWSNHNSKYTGMHHIGTKFALGNVA